MDSTRPDASIGETSSADSIGSNSKLQSVEISTTEIKHNNS